MNQQQIMPMGMPMPPQMPQQMQPQNYPMEGIAEHLANQGRYGDSMLMHVNPAEVEGIASLIPGGLPRNPMTGQPEAFIGMILSLIAKPLLAKGMAALGAKAGAGMLGSALTGLAGSSAAMTGITSGLIETARTGDIKKGFASGLMGAGIGKALGAATEAVDEGIGAATENIEGLTTDLAGAEKAISGLEALKKAGTNLTDAQQLALAQQEAIKEGITGGNIMGPPTVSGDLGYGEGAKLHAENALQRARIAANQSYGSMGDVFQPGGFKAGVGAAMSPEGFLPLALGSSQKAELDYQDTMAAEGRRREEEKAAEEQASRDLMEQSFSAIRRDYPEMRNEYNPYNEYTAAQGGIISIDPSQYAQTLQGLTDVAGPINMEAGGRAEFEIAQSYPSVGAKGGEGTVGGGFNAAGAKNRQSLIRGATLVKPGEGYRPGFDAEHRFFQNIKKDVPSIPTPVVPPEIDLPYFPEGENISLPAIVRGGEDFAMPGGMEGAGEVFPMMGRNIAQQKAQQAETSDPVSLNYSATTLEDTHGPYQEKIVDGVIYRDHNDGLGYLPRSTQIQSQESLYETAPWTAERDSKKDDSDIMEDSYISEFDPRDFMGRVGVAGMQEGGLAELAAQAAAEPSVDDAQYGQLIEQTAMALLGQMSEEEAEIIINRFIDEFGQEAFQMLREQVLQGVVPDAQTQGLVEGQGGGMDDQVQGMIGDQQRVAVSPGEFIVPADVVSGIGDGDTGAGADELDSMMERVRVERTGTAQQPPRLSAGGLLPA